MKSQISSKKLLSILGKLLTIYELNIVFKNASDYISVYNLLKALFKLPPKHIDLVALIIIGLKNKNLWVLYKEKFISPQVYLLYTDKSLLGLFYSLKSYEKNKKFIQKYFMEKPLKYKFVCTTTMHETFTYKKYQLLNFLKYMPNLTTIKMKEL